MNLNNKEALFIIGCPRSGTTLFRDILISDSRVAIPDDELQVVPSLIHALKLRDLAQIRELLKKSPFGYFNKEFDFNSLKLNGGDINSNWIYLFEQLTGNSSAAYYGDKTPENYKSISLINDSFESAKFIFVIRDPRDVVVSLRKAWGKSYIQSIHKWKESFYTYKNNHKLMEMHLVQYEDLVTKPSECLEEVGAFLSCVDLHVVTLDNFIKSKEVYGDSSGKQGIVVQSEKKYLENCPNYVRYFIEYSLGNEMRSLGYDCDYSKLNKQYLVVFFYMYSLLDVPLSYYRSIRTQIKHKGLFGGLRYKFMQIVNRYDYF